MACEQDIDDVGMRAGYAMQNLTEGHRSARILCRPGEGVLRRSRTSYRRRATLRELDGWYMRRRRLNQICLCSTELEAQIPGGEVRYVGGP